MDHQNSGGFFPAVLVREAAHLRLNRVRMWRWESTVKEARRLCRMTWIERLHPFIVLQSIFEHGRLAFWRRYTPRGAANALRKERYAQYWDGTAESTAWTLYQQAAAMVKTNPKAEMFVTARDFAVIARQFGTVAGRGGL